MINQSKTLKVTCSILCYNYGRFLAQAIESCLTQEPGDYQLEILVIDDGSTDNTPEVCALYANRVRIIRSENQGFGASIDRAIREASGDYVCLLDADDYFAPEKIITLLPQMKKGALYIEHTKYLVNENGDLAQEEPDEGGNTSTLCIQRRAALTLLPSLNEIFFHPLFYAGHGVKIDKPLSYYRLHGSSMMGGQQRASWLTHHAQVVHQLADILLSKSRDGQNDCFWADPRTLRKASHFFRTVAFYDETQAAMLNHNRAKSRRGALRIGYHILGSGTLRSPFWKTMIRGLVTGKK